MIQLTAPITANATIFGSPGREAALVHALLDDRAQPAVERVAAGDDLAQQRRRQGLQIERERGRLQLVEDEVHEGQHQLAQLLVGRRGLGAHIVEQVQQHVERVLVAGVEDLFLVAEVVVEIALRHLEGAGDLVDAGAVIAAAAEGGGGALQDVDAAIGAGERLGGGMGRGRWRAERRHSSTELNERSKCDKLTIPTEVSAGRRTRIEDCVEQPVQPTVTFETSPAQYKHWKLTFDGPIATLGMDVAGRRGPAARRLRAEAQLLRPRRRHRAGRRAAAPALRAPRGARRSS